MISGAVPFLGVTLLRQLKSEGVYFSLTDTQWKTGWGWDPERGGLASTSDTCVFATCAFSSSDFQHIRNSPLTPPNPCVRNTPLTWFKHVPYMLFSSSGAVGVCVHMWNNRATRGSKGLKSHLSVLTHASAPDVTLEEITVQHHF